MLPRDSFVRRLMVAKAAQDLTAVGGGTVGGVLNALKDSDRTLSVMREATAWVHEKLSELRACPDCPYPDDESAAQAILNRLQYNRACSPANSSPR